MKLKIGCLLEYQAFQETPLILLLRPYDGLIQTTIYEEFTLDPAVEMTQYKDLFGNYCHRLMTPTGKFVIDTTAIVETEEYTEVNPDANFTLIQNLPDHALLYLLPSRFCESDKLNNKAFNIIQGEVVGYQMVEAIRQWVRKNIKYEYDRSTSITSAYDTLEAQHGVCRDLSHLAIALCRSINIPARFVVGYLYQLYPMDLHAWFEVYLEDRWYTFDATQEFITGGRVVLAYGRDAADVATATYFGDIRLENMNVYVEKIEN
jgi:transglutaminase-like putative cysteine protease